jgi:vitamin B12 transporter
MHVLGRRMRSVLQILIVLSCMAFTPALFATVVRGTVTDTRGAAVRGAQIILVQNGKAIASTVSGPDGSYQLSTSAHGHFFILASGLTFRQVQIPEFYGNVYDNVERNIVLSPEWVRQQIVVTPTGNPVPQGQTSSSVWAMSALDFQNHVDLINSLRLMPGLVAVQQGQYGSLTSLFIRGGSSDDNKVTFDGVPAEDIGGRFDFGNVGTTGLEQMETLRGPNSTLYGSDAAAGVVALTTPRGTTSFPSLLYAGDGGRFTSYRNEVGLAGVFHKLDYYAGFSRFNSDNTLPGNKYHLVTTVGNFGWQWSAKTSIRGTVRNSVSAIGLPGAFEFYGVSDDRKQSDQDLYVGATIDNQTTYAWHNLVRYGLARKREQSQQWFPAGDPIITTAGGFPATNYFGLPLTIRGANGYSVQGPALLNYGTSSGGVYPNRLDLVSNRDQLFYQTTYKITQHLNFLGAFRFEDERGSEREPAFGINDQLERTNYDYTAQFTGDFRTRFFYALGGGIQRNQLFGTEGSPRVGLTYYLIRPSSGIFHGTKLNFNFSQGVKEPTLTEQIGSLYDFLLQQPGGQQAIQEFGISRLHAPTSRSYDGGVEQSMFSERVLIKATYFHNEFGRQIENVGYTVVPTLLPNLSPEQQLQLETLLKASGAFSLALNSMDFRAQGAEAEVQYGIGRNIFLRGGYTYLDAVVQHSFSSDALSPTFNTGLSTGPVPSFSNIPIGVYGPLVGARPFRRPPHSGFFTATYAGRTWTAAFTSAFVSRSDDSTFLGNSDVELGNSLLLPNRNLNQGFASLNLGGSYQLTTAIGAYVQMDNLLNNQHMGPIGYPTLPYQIRSGLRIALGKSKK